MMRRPRRRTVLTAVVAVLAVAAILTVAVVVRPTTQTESGTGAPTAATASTETSAATEATDEYASPTASAETSEPPEAEATEEYASPAAPASGQAAPSAPTSAAVPAPSGAIPTIDGEPISVGETPGFADDLAGWTSCLHCEPLAGVVTVLDMAINKVVAQIPVPAGPPQFIALTPDGSRAYVSIYNTEKTINLVAVLDTRTTKLLGTNPGPCGAACVGSDP